MNELTKTVPLLKTQAKPFSFAEAFLPKKGSMPR